MYTSGASTLPAGSWPQPERTVRYRSTLSFAWRLFWGALLVRILGVLLINLTGAIESLNLSPDSLRYDRVGVLIMEDMQRGVWDTMGWVDNGWFQFTGLMYYLLGPHSIYIQLVNIVIGSASATLAYQVAKQVFAIERLARLVGLAVAFFPSFVYWSTLMLKDPAAIFAILLIVRSVVQIKDRLTWGAIVTGFLGLSIVLGLREYLFFVLLFMVLISLLPLGSPHGGRDMRVLVIVAAVVGGATLAAGFGAFGTAYMDQSVYFDLEYINDTRDNINHGSGAFFDEEGVVWGESAEMNLKALWSAVFFFFVSIDITNLGSVRQLMALPEVLLVIALLPSLVRGVVYAWRYVRHRTLPLLVFTFGLLAVYGSATTNMGAMFRWRMQAMPFIVMLMVFGAYVHRKGWASRWVRSVSLDR